MQLLAGLPCLGVISSKLFYSRMVIWCYDYCMDMPLSERHQIENEMIFRRINEKIGSDLDSLDAMHTKDESLHLRWDDAILLNFRCECSDENCDQRVPIRLSVYRKIHENRDAFIIRLNHHVEAIEKVILEEENYSVVQKNNSTAEPGDVLNDTSINNT
jgi:hypothetical protein